MVRLTNYFNCGSQIFRCPRYELDMYELCPGAGATSYNKGSLEFDNGSRIIAQATTENTGRGLSISLLYCDEFAFVRLNIAKEFWTSIST